MSALEVVQSQVRAALVRGDAAGVEPLLTGARCPLARLAIHQRHFLASLTRVLIERFPATVWLVGSDLVAAAAQAFVREHPPSRPCMAEYGDRFPTFLSTTPQAAQLPYLSDFAQLEWQLGRLALAVDTEPADLSSLVNGRCAGGHVQLQESVKYLHLHWSVDELVSVFLSDTEPQAFALRAEDVWLEVRGNRGTLQMRRLSPDQFTFRAALAEGASIEDAALHARGDVSFDIVQALAALRAERLVTGINLPPTTRLTPDS